jgi:hypothetical protein
MEVTQFIRFCLDRGVPQFRIRSTLAELGIPQERVDRSLDRAGIARAHPSSIELMTLSNPVRTRSEHRNRLRRQTSGRVELQPHPGFEAIERNLLARERRRARHQLHIEKGEARTRARKERALWLGLALAFLAVYLLRLS